MLFKKFRAPSSEENEDTTSGVDDISELTNNNVPAVAPTIIDLRSGIEDDHIVELY